MAVLTKYHEKTKTLFATMESSEGVYIPPVSMDALPVEDLTVAINYESNAIQYLGSLTDRLETTFPKDSFLTAEFSTPLQVLGNLNTSLPTYTQGTVSAPMSQWLQSCGLAVSVNNTTGEVTYTNSTWNTASICFDYRQSSAQDTVNQKLLAGSAIRGTIDLSMEIGMPPKLKFSLKGNVNGSGWVQSPTLNYDFKQQLVNLAPTMRLQNIASAFIAPTGEPFTTVGTSIGAITSVTYSGLIVTVVTGAAHGLTTGRWIEVTGETPVELNGIFPITVTNATTFTYNLPRAITGAVSGTAVITAGGFAKSLCVGKIDAPNATGQDLERYLTTCEEGFTRVAVPTDVNVTVLDRPSSAVQVQTLTSSTTTVTAVASKHGFVSGDFVTIAGDTSLDSGLFNGTYQITVTDANTFTYVVDSAPSHSASGPWTATVITGSVFDPDKELYKKFAFQIIYGTRTGSQIAFTWSNLQLTNVKEDKIGSYLAKGLTFRNTGYLTFRLF